MKLQCIECGRRIDRMSRNAWRWFNEAQSLIICHKHIMDANRNGLNDPRLNEIQENEEMESDELRQNDSAYVKLLPIFLYELNYHFNRDIGHVKREHNISNIFPDFC